MAEEKPDSPSPETPPEQNPASWFNNEVRPHGPSLRSYLKREFPSVRDVDDVVQESFLRIWTARAAAPIRYSKAFLFKIGRHLALDFVRRGKISPIIPVSDLSAVNVIEDGRSVSDTADTNEKLLILADAIALLPARCREVVILRKFKGVPQRDVAARLGISERTVEVQVAKGLKRCEEYLRRKGITNLYRHEK